MPRSSLFEKSSDATSPQIDAGTCGRSQQPCLEHRLIRPRYNKYSHALSSRACSPKLPGVIIPFSTVLHIFLTMKLTAAVLAASVGLASAAELKPKHADPPSKYQGPSKQPPRPPPYPSAPHGHPGKPSKPTKTGSTGTSPSSTAGPTGYPPVDSQALQDAIKVDNLRAKAQDLEDIAYATRECEGYPYSV